MQAELTKKYTDLCGADCIEHIQPQLEAIGVIEDKMFDYIKKLQEPENYEMMFGAESVLANMAKIAAYNMHLINEILGIKEVRDANPTPLPPQVEPEAS